jgi:poly(3-hydroxyalkanoate) depolymerase
VKAAERRAAVPTTEFISVGGIRLRVSIEGRGRPLLLLNGIGAAFELLEPFRQSLSAVETIAIDMPGTGGSQSLRRPWRLSQFADLANRALHVLGFHHEVDVLGVSWGGALAQEFARRHGKRVRRLVLMATTPGWLSIPGHPQAMWALMTPRRYYSPTYFEQVAPILYGGVARTNPALLREHRHLRFIRPPSMRGYFHQLFAIWGWSSLPWLPWIKSPALVIAADDDPIVPLANARLIARRLARARLHIVPDGGHLFLVTHADEVAPVVERFLDGDAAVVTREPDPEFEPQLRRAE